MKKNSRFFCNNCKRFFCEPKRYEERHNLDAPPYEVIFVCSKCGSGDFCEFETDISKFEVVEGLLRVTAFINRYVENLKNLYGINLKNEELDEASGLINEMICEMFDYMDIDVKKKLFKIRTKNDVEQILVRLRG